MRHFHIVQWTEYVRGFVSPAERDLMDRHVQEGCELCGRLAGLVACIQETSAAEVAVPEHLVRSAKAIFRPAGAATEASPWPVLPRLAGRLVVDSLASSAVVGTRAAPSAEGHMVYHAGDYTIDLQIERDPESNELTLVGQLADRTRSGCPIGGVSVLLTARDKLIARAESNRFGEFCLVGRALHGLTLRVPLKGAGKQLVVPLAGMAEGAH